MSRIVLTLSFLLALGAIPANATCDAGQSSTTPFSVGGTYTVVQFCAYSPTAFGDANRAQFLQALASGNLSVVVAKHCQSVSCSTSHPGAITVSDSVNGTYGCPAGAVLSSPDADNTQSICWFCGTAASAVTVTYSGTSDWVYTAVYEVHSTSGSCSGLILDTHGPTGSSFPAATTTPSIATLSATAKANELVINQMFYCPNTVTTTATGIFTKTAVMGNGTSGCGVAMEMGNVASAGTTAASSWTVSPASSTNGVIVTLTPFTGNPVSSHHSTIVNYRSVPHYQLPWDNRRRKLKIVVI